VPASAGAAHPAWAETSSAGRSSGIWRYADRYSVAVPQPLRASHGEGGTPLPSYPALASACGLESLWLKREDLNPTGAHKDRGIAFQIAALRTLRPGLGHLVICSSGNGAIAAASYAALSGLRVVACVSPRTPPDKLGRLGGLGACVLLSEEAISLAEGLAMDRGWPNLRPSVDPLAPEGFMSLAWELQEAAEPAEGIFLFASSGTGLVGLARGLDHPAAVPWRAPLQVVQGAGGDPIATAFDRRPKPQEGRSMVGRLGSRKTRRLGEATRAVRASGGGGWSVGDAETLEALDLLRGVGIESALEGAAALAAARRAAVETGLRRAIVIISGRAAAPELAPEGPGLPVVDGIDAAKRRLEAWL